MFKIFSLPISVLIISLLSCKSRQPGHVSGPQEYSKKTRTPPGTIKIKENLYIDESEVINLSYLEFIYWTKRVYGSDKCKTILPDTNVWNELSNFNLQFNLPDYYLRHPAFRYYPVVGVSYDQALKFCKWRSDRVMEFILISYGIFDHNPSPDASTAFTIEKYFTGQYKGIIPNPNLRYYPVYYLPDSTTFMHAVKFADSLNKANYKYHGKNDDILGLLKVRCLDNIPLICDSNSCKIQPTRISWVQDYSKHIIINLSGNVRELTDIESVSFGGSFIDSCSTLNTKYFYRTGKVPNAFTGFRCSCRWEKWAQ